MMLNFLFTAAFAGLSASTALASPVGGVKRSFDDLKWISKNASLPKVVWVGTLA
jgi:hypothetical protein